MKDSKYWEKRAEQILIEAERNSNTYLNQLNVLYKNTSESIDREIAKIFETYKKDFTMSEAKAWLNEEIPRFEYDKLKESLSEITDERYRKQVLMRLNAPAYRYRITRLQQIKQTIMTELSKSADIQLQLSKDCYINTLNHSYERAMFDIQQGTGIVFNLAKLPQETVNRLLSAKWYGRNFSSSIWRNRGIVAKAAGDIIKEGVLSGQSVQQMSKSLMNRTYTQSMYNATRLIRTEVNYFVNQGAIESYKEAELDKYEFCATLDLRTSEICGKLDGNIYLLDKAVVGENCPPMHPYCRSFGKPIIEADGLARMNKRRARNPETGKNEIIDNMSYKEWRAKYVDNNPKALVNEKMIKNKSADQKQYSKYKVLLGKDAPTSLAKFQDLKYNNSSKYEDLKSVYGKKSRYEHLVKTANELEIKGVLKTEFERMDVSDYNFDNKHTNIVRNHGTSKKDAQHFIDSAVVLFERWHGEVRIYVSADGCSVVNTTTKMINTAYRSDEYDNRFKTILEVASDGKVSYSK